MPQPLSFSTLCASLLATACGGAAEAPLGDAAIVADASFDSSADTPAASDVEAPDAAAPDSAPYDASFDAPREIDGGAPDGGDTEYGPTQIDGGDCPRIPQEFANTYDVTDRASLDAALANVGPGDAIIFRDGMHTSARLALDVDGTADERIYLLSESLHGAEIRNSPWTINGDYITVAGFRFSSTGRQNHFFRATGTHLRIACNRSDGGVDGRANSDPSENLDPGELIKGWHRDDISPLERPRDANWEIDNNTFVELRSGFLQTWNCNPRDGRCLGHPRGIHVHHNEITSLPGGTNAHIIYLGLAFIPENGEDDPWTHERLTGHMIFENNRVRWRTLHGKNVTDFKVGSNVIRNNCFTDTQPWAVRTGHGQAMYGNWYRGTGANFLAHIPIGRWNVDAFNYYGGGRDTQHAAYSFSVGQNDTRPDSSHLWAYYPHNDGIASNNVFNRYGTFLRVVLNVGNLRRFPLLEGFDPNPVRNYVRDNLMYTSASVLEYRHDDHDYDLIQFRAGNPDYEAPQVIDAPLDQDVACGTPAHVRGVGDSLRLEEAVPGIQAHLHPSVPGTLTAPSWW